MTSWEESLSNYRRTRKGFHGKFHFSREAIWQEAYLHYHQERDLQLLERWEDEYWEKVKDGTTLFPKTERVLEDLVSEYQVALITNAQGRKTSGKHRLSQFPELERFLT